MALRNIREQGEPILNKVCKPVTEMTPRIKELIEDMLDTMYDASGVGLAAPQIGQAIRLVVIDVQDEHGLLEMVNPEIVAREGTAVDSEGCLSVPEVFGDVERAAKVTVDYTNRWGKRKKLTAGGLLARCIQHELDHLSGVLFIDVAKSIRKKGKE